MEHTAVKCAKDGRNEVVDEKEGKKEVDKEENNSITNCTLLT
jgi:hypothetical protein